VPRRGVGRTGLLARNVRSARGPRAADRPRARVPARRDGRPARYSRRPRRRTWGPRVGKIFEGPRRFDLVVSLPPGTASEEGLAAGPPRHEVENHFHLCHSGARTSCH